MSSTTSIAASAARGSAFRSVAAVLAGFITVFFLSTATDFLLEATGVFTPPSEGFFVTWMIVLAVVYRTIYTALGGFLAARLAPHRPMLHAVILGAIGVVMGTLGAVVSAGRSPLWFPVLLIVLTLPAVWFGAKVAEEFTGDRRG
jgi:hypothetical protein